MNPRNLALIAAFITAIIYGVSFTVAKEVMPDPIKPYAFITLRVFGATLLFWFSSFFVKSQKIERKDFYRIVAAAFFGVALNMLTFFKGLSYTTPITAASIMVTTPILVLILASILLKEKLHFQKIIGVVIGLVAAIVLITYGHESSSQNSNVLFGDFLVFINAASYATYLVIVKKLTKKYNPFNFVKWLYTFGFIMVLPFGFSELLEVEWHSISSVSIYKIGFIIVFTTFITYLFNLLALTKLKPTTVSIFMYLQPVVASMYALYAGSDSLNSTKIIATLFIFLGVFLVTKAPKKTSPVSK